MSDNFTKIKFDTVFNVKSTVTLFYMELNKNFKYDGESHNFWEMVYIDKGEMICTAGKNRFTLKSGEIAFHKPNEFHNLEGNNVDSPNVSIITFDCNNAAMSYFDGKIFKLNHEEKFFLSQLFAEGLSCYEMEDENNPLIQKMHCKNNCPFGSSQATKNFLELFLIKLYRSGFSTTKAERRNYVIDGLDVPHQIKETIDFMKENICNRITVKQIAKHINTSESQIKKLFSMYYSGGLIKYFNSLKISEAKRLIREDKLNMAQISEYLSFDNPQYFTKCFTKYAKMTPSQYKHSIKNIKKSP